ncbi:ribonuclease H-like domain-containing protein [Tanacetum coccineum]
MSEAENHPPASSVTALRIPIIKKGEYDLWCMKMRQYIAITDHILWDIITYGDQATTEPASSSDKHLLRLPCAKMPRVMGAIKGKIWKNKESKKMQKNLLKQQFETFVVGAREELDSAYDRFQNIISMLELYDAKVSCEDANLKFLRSLPSVWHVVATMIRGQPGLDELDFDDLYNNLKVYEHELKGASSSNSQSIAFMSAEIKGSTSRQSTADDKSEIITKGYAQASSSKLKETLNSSFNSDEIICSFFAQHASMPETHDDEDLLQIDDDAMEEIDIRWQVAMITARIRKFMRKTGRPIDLKPKNGITFDKSKIECFRECKFAKYQANRANGSKEKRVVPIEYSNSKALVAKDSQGEIDWTKEFDDDPVTFAMVALNEIEEDDWSIEIDVDHVDLRQDGLGVFDWSEEADNAPVALALMATSSTDSSNSEVPYCSNCSKSYKKLLNDYQTEKDNFQRARLEIQGYQLSLESLEVIIRTHEKNEYAWGDKYELMEYDLKMRDWKLGEKQKELDNVIKERDELKEKLEKWSNATLLQTEILNKQKVLSDKTCIGFGVEYSSSEESNNSSGDETLTGPLYENFKREKAYKAVPPPTGTIIPPRADVAFTGIDELAIRNKVINKQNSESSGTDHESCESKNRDDLIKNKEQTQNTVKSNTDRNKVIIEDWVDSDDEEVPLGFSEIKKQTVLKSETSSENKSPRSKDSFGQRSRSRPPPTFNTAYIPTIRYLRKTLTTSEAENHPPASSVTALGIPIIKKGKYDLWCMKIRQYIAITNHILWDIITNGDQATTEPTSSSGQPSVPKTLIVVNARRNNEKALNILLSAIPDRHLLSFHDAQDARSLWAAIKARFGGNKESKKMQKNLLKQQFETFVVGAREELDSAYERFQKIISMLELYDAKVSCEYANLKFLRSLPYVWHVVATMIRGQPGLDELDFDDLYNNLKVYEHELKGASSSNSQSIAFMSAEIKGSTSRQSTANDNSEIITKGYAQASSSKLKETLNSSFNSDEIICSFFAQQASMPETHDDEDLLQIDDDAMEEIDIRWQVAMITARIRKFMRKTGRPIDLKPKNGITFDKSKIECFNCQKLGHFARECKFAKYQANRANGSKEKRIVPIEDSNSKALVAKDSQGEIDWTKEFDDDPVTFAMVALNGIEEDDWSIEIDADHVDLGQDGLGVFDWSEEADNAPVALALMATSSTDSSNSEVPYCSNCSKSYKKLLNDYQTEKDNFQRARLEIQGYQLSLESLEVIIRTHEKNEYAWGDKYEQMEYDLKMRDWKLGEKQKEFENVIKERDELKEKLEKWSNATLLQTEILNKQKVLNDKTCIGFGVEYSSSEEKVYNSSRMKL